MNDGTCAFLRSNGSGIMKNIYWVVNLNCGKRPQEEGVTIFEISLFNFLNPRIKCNYSPTGCGWQGDAGYSSKFANGYDKSSCQLGSNYAWKSYECYMKIVQDGFKIKDDYNFYKQPRKSAANTSVWSKF